jgi:hypothetical protein
MVLKVVLSRVPTVLITVTAATAIKAAMRPYSIAVAAVSSRKTFAKRAFMAFMACTEGMIKAA